MPHYAKKLERKIVEDAKQKQKCFSKNCAGKRRLGMLKKCCETKQSSIMLGYCSRVFSLMECHN